MFDFIRHSEDKEALKRLVEEDVYYREMEEDAFDVVVHYANAKELVEVKDYHRKEGKIDMCTAIKELIADGIAEEKQKMITRMIKFGMPDKDIRMFMECDQASIDAIRRTLR